MDRRQNGPPGGGPPWQQPHGGDRYHGGGGRDPRYQGAGGGYRGGRGGGYQGGGGRGGGGRGRGDGARGPENKPLEAKVFTNYFGLFFRKDVDWTQYDVEIHHYVRKKKKDTEGNLLQPTQWEFVPRMRKRRDEEGNVVEHEHVEDLLKGSNPLSRRVLLKLQEQLLQRSPESPEPRYFVPDGGAIAFAPAPLFSSDTTHLGKRSYNELVSDDASPPPTPPNEFYVKVKLECDENDEYADSARSGWFLVRLKETKRIRCSISDQGTLMAAGAGERQLIGQCIETILKNQMIAIMVAFGRSPQKLFFPEGHQYYSQAQRLLGYELNRVYRNERSPNVAPLVWATQVVRCCMDGHMFVARDAGVSFIYRDKSYRTPPEERPPVPMLVPDRSGQGGTLFGVRIEDLHTRVSDPTKQAQIEDAVRDALFNARFEKSLTKEAFQKLVEEGLNEAEIARRRVVFRPNQRMWNKNRDEPGIVWAADDPELHIFEVKGQPQPFTVADYFFFKYRVTLQFPKMPMIRTKKYGYYPVEMLYQAFGKAKGANSPEQVNHVLKFHDEFACDGKIEHVKNTFSEMSDMQAQSRPDIASLLNEFGVSINSEPKETKAKVLPYPRIEFAGTSADPDRGSWRLHRVEFKRPADLTSFAVVDFANNFRPCLEGLLNAAKGHGMVIPDYLPRALFDNGATSSGSVSTPETIGTAINNAIHKAKEFFLYDRNGFFKKNHILFHSRVRITREDNRSETSECLVEPAPQGNRLKITLPRKTLFETHIVQNPENNKQERARKVIRVRDIRSIRAVDPFDFRLSARGHEAWLDGEWTRVGFVDYAWELENGDIFEADERVEPLLANIKESEIDCPSILFAFLPSKDTQPYNAIKLCSNFDHGIQSQCIVSATFKRQNRNPGQYFSNIALKLNTKLANKWNNACAFEVSESIQGQSIPWSSEVPTLIMGLSLSKGSGRESKRIVAASACIDTGSFMKMGQQVQIQEGAAFMKMGQQVQIQEGASNIVASHLLESITKTLAIHYYQHTGHIPQRVLVYRDGSSEGQFDSIREHEISAIRRAFYEINESYGDKCCKCKESDSKGCLRCTPRITFIVCLNQHNVRVVPAPKSDPTSGSRNSENVHSGTCVDDMIMPFRDGLNLVDSTESSDPQVQVFGHSSSTSDGCDFLLTAQHGLKGTSRPVFYRVLSNENLLYKPQYAEHEATPLTLNVLQNLTYAMSFQYGTATKAVRSVPVVLYSSRLANVMASNVPYLIRDGKIEQVPLGSDSAENVWVRRDLRDAPSDAPSDAIPLELIPAFSPCDQVGTWIVPFRPHLAA